MSDSTELFRALQDHGAVGAGEKVCDFGDPEAEYRRLASGGVLAVPLLQAGSLRLAGTDRVDFLHGQISSDVRGLGPGGTREGLVLSHRGHALAQLRVLRRADDLWVVVEGGATGAVEKRFRDHIVFDQVVVENGSGRLAVLSAVGSGAEGLLGGLLGDLPESGRFLQVRLGEAELMVHRSRRTGYPGFDLHLPAERLPSLLQLLTRSGAMPGGETALDSARVEAGISRADREAGEGVLPQEAGLDQLVSHTKGCYLGQEIMARIEARGQPRRKLAGVRFGRAPSQGPRDLFQEDRQVGRLGTVARHPDLGWVGLAVVRRDLASPEVQADDTPALVVELPFSNAGR